MVRCSDICGLWASSGRGSGIRDPVAALTRNEVITKAFSFEAAIMPHVQPPNGYHTVVPYLVASDVGALIEFVTGAFDGIIRERMVNSSGRIAHAEIEIGDSVVMMGEAQENFAANSASLYLYVGDTVAVYAQALRRGATSVMEPADMYYGDRNAGVRDPAGNTWWIATRFRDVSAEELEKLAKDR